MQAAARQPSLVRGLLLFLLGGLVGANATYFVMTRNDAPVTPVVIDAASVPTAPNEVATDSTQHRSSPRLPLPLVSMRGAPMSPDSMPTTKPTAISANDLLIPVQGVIASQLTDTFADARSADRVHDAIDIMAPAGTPVLAVADGHVEKLFTSKLGGLTIYEFNQDGTLAYYYAHLQRYADDLSEQKTIRRGQVIGYVGSTGNASPEAPHLHFAIFELGPEKQWWKGEAINPYPWLTGTSATATP